jgi:hypothetical protein
MPSGKFAVIPFRNASISRAFICSRLTTRHTSRAGSGKRKVANVFPAFFGELHDGHFGQDGNSAVPFDHADEGFRYFLNGS